MKKTVRTEPQRYWSWVPFLVFIFSAEFLKKHKGHIVNYIGNGIYNHDIKPSTLYVHYPSIDATPTGLRMREAMEESDTLTFCGFGREDGAREGFVQFKLNEEMRNAVTFGDALPSPETIATAVRLNFYPGLNPSGTKWNEGFRQALLNFTRGDAPQLAIINGAFKALNGVEITALNVDSWLLETTPKSLLARVRGVKPAATTTTTNTTNTTNITSVKREILPTDW